MINNSLEQKSFLEMIVPENEMKLYKIAKIGGMTLNGHVYRFSRLKSFEQQSEVSFEELFKKRNLSKNLLIPFSLNREERSMLLYLLGEYPLSILKGHAIRRKDWEELQRRFEENKQSKKNSDSEVNDLIKFLKATSFPGISFHQAQNIKEQSRETVEKSGFVHKSILPKKTLKISEDFKNEEKSIQITPADIRRLNSRIRESVEKNEKERLDGLNSDSVNKSHKGTHSQEKEKENN